MSQRALKYLHDKRIIYRRYSPDKPSNTFDWGWYYSDGTYGYYSLFNTKAKILPGQNFSVGMPKSTRVFFI